MKIENKSNKIEKRRICDFEGQNHSKGVLFFDFFSDLLGKKSEQIETVVSKLT